MRFKKSRLENGETPEQFVERIRQYLRKWREMAHFEETYKVLEDLIVRDQYFLTCPKELQTFLKEPVSYTHLTLPTILRV